MQKLKVGTLISDNNKLGVVTKIIEIGTLDVEIDIINWRANYEIHYIDGIVAILGCKTVARLIKEKKIKVIYQPTTPLPHSSSKQLVNNVIHMQEENETMSEEEECESKKKDQ